MKTTLAVAMCLAACGGGGAASVTLDDLGTQLSDTLCTKAFRCCTQAQITALFNSTTTITTTDQCEMYEGTLAGFAIAHYQASLAAGRIKYDGGAAASCLDIISNATCAAFDVDATATAAPPGCDPFVIAQVDVAGGCTQNYECTTGYCKGAVTTPNPIDGMCAPIPTMGQTCTSTCASGLYCDFGTLTCQATKVDGSACSMGFECKSAGCTGGLCGLICPGT